MDNHKRIRSVALTVFLTAIVYLLVFAILLTIPGLIQERTLTLVVIAISLSIIGAAILYYWIKERAEIVDTLSDELSAYKRIIGMKTHTFHVINALKEVKIINDNGDATLRYSFQCENTSEKEIEHIRIRITHDGNLVKDSVRCEVNGQDVRPVDVRELITIDAKTLKEVETMARTLTFKIHAEKQKLRPMEKFEYGYSYEARKLYPNIKKENQEFSQTSILHPTSRLHTVFEAPEGYAFVEESKIEVFDRDDVKHSGEEKRLSSESPPIRVGNGKILLWTVYEPLLANSYLIYLSIKRIA